MSSEAESFVMFFFISPILLFVVYLLYLFAQEAKDLDKTDDTDWS